MNVLDAFITRCRSMNKPRVLELGTKRSVPDRSTKHAEWVPTASEFLGTDLEPGIDVDFTADVHQLSAVVGHNQFDIIISCSSFEHFKYPHVAAHEVMKVLRMGGLLFIQTHQTFPLHGYPFDYFRFSREALSGLFGTRMGFRVISTDYEFPAVILSERDPLLKDLEAYLNVRLFGEKTGDTPDEYIFDFF
jgi:SAM-dependent methyltransferase